MKKFIALFFVLALIACPRAMFAANEGLHLGGMDKDAKKAKIEAKKAAHKADKESERAKKQACREAEKKKREAEKAKKQAEQEAEKVKAAKGE